MEVYEVAVVIPAYNERQRVIQAVQSIVEHNQARVKFYIADDGSNDGTAKAVHDYMKERSIPGRVFSGEQNLGAGFRRNQAFEHVKEPFTLFFDADDFVYPGMLDRAVEKAKAVGCEILLMEYERVFDLNDKKLGMIPGDQKIFRRIKKNSAGKCFSVSNNGFVLDLVNYPWNKLVATSYAKNIGLKFSNTPVHNDVTGHWMLLMNAKRVAVLNEAFCAHRVSPEANQITNISDDRRLAMLEVFGELDLYFERNHILKSKFYHFFISFKLRLYRWALQRLDDEHKIAFREGFAMTFGSMEKFDFLKLSERMPSTANDALRFRLGLV